MVAKLFHKILAMRLEEYLIQNSIIDKSLQKGYLNGVNGCVEHVFAVQSIIGNAQENSLPLALGFIDLRNAFGSVAHSYIDDILTFHPNLGVIFITSTPLYLLMYTLRIGKPDLSTSSMVVFFKAILYHRSFFSLLSTLSFSQ